MNTESYPPPAENGDVLVAFKNRQGEICFRLDGYTTRVRRKLKFECNTDILLRGERYTLISRGGKIADATSMPQAAIIGPDNSSYRFEELIYPGVKFTVLTDQ